MAQGIPTSNSRLQLHLPVSPSQVDEPHPKGRLKKYMKLKLYIDRFALNHEILRTLYVYFAAQYSGQLPN